MLAVKVMDKGKQLRVFQAGAFFGEIAFVASAKKAFGVGLVLPQEQLVDILKSQLITQLTVY